MLIKHLALRNYKQYASLDLTFREGLIGIIGKNGSGKSTLFDAVLYCLYGGKGKDELKKEYIRSTYAADDTPVSLSLTFELGQQLYTVKREFRGKNLSPNAELYKNEDMIAKGMNAVSVEVTKLLHMERDAFKKSCFSGQKELDELSTTAPEERKRIIRKMMGLERLDTIKNLINDDKRKLTEAIKTLSANGLAPELLAEYETQIATFATQIEQTQLQLATAQTEVDELKEALAKAKILTQQESVRKEQYDTLQLRLTQLTATQSQVQQRCEELCQQQQNLQALALLQAAELPTIRYYKEAKADFESMQKQKDLLQHLEGEQIKAQLWSAEVVAKKDKIATLHTDLQRKPALLKELPALQQWLKERDTEKKALEHTLKQLNMQQGDLQGKIKEREKRIKSLRQLGKAGECPTCFRPLLEEYDHVVQTLSDEITHYTQQMASTLQEEQTHIQRQLAALTTGMAAEQTRFIVLQKDIAGLEELELQVKDLEQETTHLQLRIEAIERTLQATERPIVNAATLDALRQIIQQHQDTYLAHQQRAGQLAYLPTLTTQIQAQEKIAHETADALHQCRQQIQMLAFSPEAYQALQVKRDTLQAQQLTAANNFADTRQQLLNFQHQQTQVQQSLTAHQQWQATIAQHEQALYTQEQLSTIFDQFKNEILEKISPMISEYAGYLFNRITNGKYDMIHVDEVFQFYIIDNGVRYPLNRYSGGEQDLANLCLRIAITQAIGEMNGSDAATQFLALDEILGSQDDERRSQILAAFNTLRTEFRQIYIISHLEDVRDYFEHILEVSDSPQGSQVRWI